MVPPTLPIGVLRRTLLLTTTVLVAQAAVLPSMGDAEPVPAAAVVVPAPEKDPLPVPAPAPDVAAPAPDAAPSPEAPAPGSDPGRTAQDPTDRPLPEPTPPNRPAQPTTPTPAPTPAQPAPSTPGKGNGAAPGKDDTSAPLPETPSSSNGNSGPGRNVNRGDQQQTPTQPTQPQPPTQTETPTQPTQPTGQQPTAQTTPQSQGGSTQGSTGRRAQRNRTRQTSGGGGGGAGTTAPAPAALTAPLGTLPLATAPAGSDDEPSRRRTLDNPKRRPNTPAAVVQRTVRQIVRVIPGPVKAAFVAMLGLVVMLGTGYLALAVRTRRLERQREELLQEVGLLQAALLPTVPGRVGTLRASVAYRPAAGVAAGGDFYDAFELGAGRIGIVVGDVAGHGREALAQTALMRYTLRVYLETGIEPRKALNLAGGALREDLGAGFATALVAVYDPGEGTLRYASAGHPPPVLLGPPAHEPVTASSSPPIGIGAPTGLRQTTVGFGPDAVACFFTDGLTEARIGDEMLGRERVAAILEELGQTPKARELLDRIVDEAEHATDDMAACVIRPTVESFANDLRVEELEVDLGDPIEREARPFLSACGLPDAEITAAVEKALAEASRSGGAIIRVQITGDVAEVSVDVPYRTAVHG